MVLRMRACMQTRAGPACLQHSVWHGTAHARALEHGHPGAHGPAQPRPVPLAHGAGVAGHGCSVQLQSGVVVQQ